MCWPPKIAANDIFIERTKNCFILQVNHPEHENPLVLICLIAPLSDIPMFYIKYLTMHKVHMHAGAIRQLLFGCASVLEIILPYIRTNHTIIYTYLSTGHTLCQCEGCVQYTKICFMINSSDLYTKLP